MISSCPSPSSAIPHRQEEPAAVHLRPVSVPVSVFVFVSVPASVSVPVSVPASAPAHHTPPEATRKTPGECRGTPRPTPSEEVRGQKVLWLTEDFRRLHTFGRRAENTGKLHTFGRWEKAAGNENARTGTTEGPGPIAHLRKVSRKHGKITHLRKVGEGSWRRKRAYRPYRGFRADCAPSEGEQKTRENCAPSEGGKRRLETKTRVQALQRVPGRLRTFGR